MSPRNLLPPLLAQRFRVAGCHLLLLLASLTLGWGCVRTYDTGDGADLGAEIDVRIVDSTADAPDTGGLPPPLDAAFEGWTADIPDWCTCEETDLNNDGTVSTVDFGQFLACFGKDATGSCLAADFNGDGVVGNIDFLCFQARLGQVCS